jgi:hypothetical protein
MFERALWLMERRRIAEERMNTLWAPIYDENWGTTIEPSHRRMVDCLLGLLDCDAACGTGKYWPVLLEHPVRAFGIDQAQGMLACAQAKHPNRRRIWHCRSFATPRRRHSRA